MSSTNADAAIVGALFVAASHNSLALDHLVRLRREADQYAQDFGDPTEADGYIVTAVLNALAMAEDARIESEVRA